MYKIIFKKVIDFFISLLLLILLLPVFIFIVILLSFTKGNSAFFYQERPGKNGKLFRLIKFKTMREDKDASGRLLPDAARLTQTGRFLRKTSLDEIPQLINVLRGEMSLVGPRPLLIEYLPLYSNFQSRRHEVLPGITGWAQVNGRNAISWNEKFAYDVWYVDHLSFGLDMKILFITMGKVLRSEDVNATAKLTMEKFTGKN